MKEGGGEKKKKKPALACPRGEENKICHQVRDGKGGKREEGKKNCRRRHERERPAPQGKKKRKLIRSPHFGCNAYLMEEEKEKRGRFSYAHLVADFAKEVRLEKRKTPS